MVNTLRPTADFPHIHLSAGLLIYPAIYFVLGYLLYATLFAAVGAAVSSEQDAQQLQVVIMLPLIFSFVMFNMVIRDPNSHTVVLLSEIPFFTPIIMVFRIACETPPFWQIGLSLSAAGLDGGRGGLLLGAHLPRGDPDVWQAAFGGGDYKVAEVHLVQVRT